MNRILLLFVFTGSTCTFAFDLDESSVIDKKYKHYDVSPFSGRCDSIVSSTCESAVFENSSLSSKKFSGSGGVHEISIYNGANNNYVNPNNAKFNQNAIANFNITNSNQTTLQTYSPELNYDAKSPIELIRNNLAVPIKTGDNSSISVMPDKVEFNLTY